MNDVFVRYKRDPGEGNLSVVTQRCQILLFATFTLLPISHILNAIVFF
jgi:hypothetical protein